MAPPRFVWLHTAAGLPVAVNVTTSLATAAPVTPFFTVALMLEVLVLLAGTEVGVAVTVIVFGTGV
jgi:hypothetical protein